MKIYVLDSFYPDGVAYAAQRAEVIRWDDPRAAATGTRTPAASWSASSSMLKREIRQSIDLASRRVNGFQKY